MNKKTHGVGHPPACGIDDAFIHEWHLKPGQALVVPEYLDLNEYLQVNTWKAAWELQDFLKVLAEGKSVSEAVAAANKVADLQHAAHHWKVIPDGGGSVSFK